VTTIPPSPIAVPAKAGTWVEWTAERVRRLRQYGWDDARQAHETGFNSRLDPLQAAILQAKLGYLDTDNTRRAVIAPQYELGLRGVPIKTPKSALTLSTFITFTSLPARSERL